MLSFDHRTHTNLLRTSAELARKYRIDCGLEKPIVEIKNDSNKWIITPIKEEKANNTSKEQLKATEELKTPENEVLEESTEISRDELKEKLEKAWITYFKGAKTDKLVELCIENNLL